MSAFDDFFQRQRRTEREASPYRGMRAYTAWTRVKKTARDGGTLDFENGHDYTAEGHAPVQFQLDENGKCHTIGCVDGCPVGAVLWTYPPGLRPTHKERFICPTLEPSIFATLEVDVDGTLTLVGFG